MSNLRRKLMAEPDGGNFETMINLPLAYEGDIYEKVSGNAPVHGVGSMLWDPSKQMYKFVTDAPFYNYSVKWELADKYKDFTQCTGFTLAIDVIQEYSRGMGYVAWCSLPDLNEVISGHEDIYTGYGYIAPIRYTNNFEGQIPMHRYTATFLIADGADRIARWYQDGIFIKEILWGRYGKTKFPSANYVTICQIHSNTTQLSMWAKNFKVYPRILTDEEVAQEYAHNIP